MADADPESGFAVGPSGHSLGSTCREASDNLYIFFSFPRIRVSVVEYYDADNDRFHVTVFFGAGREVSGRRRLVYDNVESFLFAGSISQRAGLYSPPRIIYTGRTWSNV